MSVLEKNNIGALGAIRDLHNRRAILLFTSKLSPVVSYEISDQILAPFELSLAWKIDIDVSGQLGLGDGLHHTSN